jgi:uncharacterized protein
VKSPASAEAQSTDDPRSRLGRLQLELRDRLQEGLIVAFSGGVDSAFLLWAAEQTRRRFGGHLLALTTTSESSPRRDSEDASCFARELGVEQVVRESHEFRLAQYIQNDEDRCYHCKAELFEIAEALSGERDARWIAYGYNASDTGDVRPGHRAATEHGILAPLADAGLTKDDIRSLMRSCGLKMAEKPASPCLSSRIMTGLEITPGRLEDVEALESILREGGVRVCRVRVCGDTAPLFLRVEVPRDEMARVLTLRDDLLREGRARGYRWVTLDLCGYRTGGGRS